MQLPQPRKAAPEIVAQQKRQSVCQQKFTRHGVYADSAMRSGDQSPLRHIQPEKIGHGPLRVTRSVQTVHLGIAKPERVAVIQQKIRLKCGMIRQSELSCIGQIARPICILPIGAANRGFCAAHGAQALCRAQMVDMPVRMDNPSDVFFIEAQRVHIVQHQLQQLVITAVQQDQPLASIDQMHRCRPRPNKIQIPNDLKRRHIRLADVFKHALPLDPAGVHSRL